MFNRIANIISGDPIQRQLESYREIVDRIAGRGYSAGGLRGGP
jgi:hypothetical protein